MHTDGRLRMRNPWDVFEIAMNDVALAEDLLRDRRTRIGFREELERTLRMFELPAPMRGETPGIATARRERDAAAPKAVLALR